MIGSQGKNSVRHSSAPIVGQYFEAGSQYSSTEEPWPKKLGFFRLLVDDFCHSCIFTDEYANGRAQGRPPRTYGIVQYVQYG